MLPYVAYNLLVFAISIVDVQSSCSCDLPDSNFASGVNLIYYKCNNDTPATLSYPINTNELVKLVNVLDPNKQTIFYIFGYHQSPTHSNVINIINALCYNQTDNVVVLDWSKYSMNISYQNVFENSEKVGSLFAQSLKILVDNGLDVTNIYIIGHSLGAHIAGFAGKCNNFKIPRITGLDPANRMFYPTGCYLTSNDATWVDVIHTDGGGNGDMSPMGTADYYVNGGHRIHPECNNINTTLSIGSDCNTEVSVLLYAISKYNGTTYNAKQCSSYQFCAYSSMPDCKDLGNIGIGYIATNRTGIICINTNSGATGL